MHTLPIQRYQFDCQVQSTLALNDYSGSMLRGAFGHALRHLSCVTGMTDCKQCMLYKQCTYPAIFEPPTPSNAHFQQSERIPNPYIIEAPEQGARQLQAGDHFSFNLVLIGDKAISQLAFLINAWAVALQQGLGKRQACVQLQQVSLKTEQQRYPIYTQGQTELLSTPTIEAATFPTNSDKVHIQLLSPLRIQRQKRLLINNMQGKDFINSLVRRYYLLQEFYAQDYQAPDFSALRKQAEAVQARTQLKRYRYTRHSSRQKRKIPLESVLGEIELTGELTAFLPLLHQGQWSHIGSNTSLGFGQYVLSV